MFGIKFNHLIEGVNGVAENKYETFKEVYGVVKKMDPTVQKKASIVRL